MSINNVEDLLAALRRMQLLAPEQVDEVQRELGPLYQDPRDLAEQFRGAFPPLGGRLAQQAVGLLEAPRLAQHRQQMEQRLGEVVGADVTVKAKRPEGLGALGRAEGVACWAVALIESG